MMLPLHHNIPLQTNKSSRHVYDFFRRAIIREENQMQQRVGIESVKRYTHNTTTLLGGEGIRISTLLQRHLGLSRRQSERMVLTERITLYGNVVRSPLLEVTPPARGDQIAIKVDGRLAQGVEKTLKILQKEQEQTENDASIDRGRNTQISNSNKDCRSNKTRVWLCNKLKGELITEDDPDGRPSMLQRLIRGGVGHSNDSNHLPIHLKPVGRLDMMTEGLLIVTNNGQYARSLELPSNQLWRTYRVRVHGRLTLAKLNAMRKGVTVKIDDDVKDKTASGEVVKGPVKYMKYKGIKVSVERKSIANKQKRGGTRQNYSGGTNTWLQITCMEGKNRMLRRILGSMGLDVTRLIRTSYGDYDLNTIPPGRAVEVPPKSLEKMKKKGTMIVSESESSKFNPGKKKSYNNIITKSDGEDKQTNQNVVEWIHYS